MMAHRPTYTEVIRVGTLLEKCINDLPEHESCGVDSFNYRDRLIEYLDSENFMDGHFFHPVSEPQDPIEDVSVTTAHSLIFAFEYNYSIMRLRARVPLADVLEEIKERFPNAQTLMEDDDA